MLTLYQLFSKENFRWRWPTGKIGKPYMGGRQAAAVELNLG